MLDRPIAWLWARLRPHVEAMVMDIVTDVVATLRAEQQAVNEAAATQPARRYMGSRPSA